MRSDFLGTELMKFFSNKMTKVVVLGHICGNRQPTISIISILWEGELRLVREAAPVGTGLTCVSCGLGG